jgi:exodeoxyribonuclease-3
MKIASWNVNGIRARTEHVVNWLEATQPDVLAIQESKVVDDLFPYDEYLKLGYHSLVYGQKAYNGVALLSKKEPINPTTGISGFKDSQTRVVSASYEGITVIDVYVPNGQSVGSDKFVYKLEWLDHLTRYIEKSLKENENLIVLGDFNIAPEDQDVYDPEDWKDRILCSKQERGVLENLFALGLVDSFRLFKQQDASYSWWDYRAAAYRRKMGLRIDLILLSTSLAKRCAASTIDESPRGWLKPSDHAPVIVEVDVG